MGNNRPESCLWETRTGLEGSIFQDTPQLNIVPNLLGTEEGSHRLLELGNALKSLHLES